jgi:hypothetical protein
MIAIECFYMSIFRCQFGIEFAVAAVLLPLMILQIDLRLKRILLMG